MYDVVLLVLVIAIALAAIPIWFSFVEEKAAPRVPPRRVPPQSGSSLRWARRADRTPAPVPSAQPARSAVPLLAADPAPPRAPAIRFAPGSAELDAPAHKLLATMVDILGAQALRSITLAASYDPSETADPKTGRALARARAKAVQDALENGGLAMTYFSRVDAREAAVRIEWPSAEPR